MAFEVRFPTRHTDTYAATGATQAARREGDFIECGVDRGGSTMCVINYVGRESFSGRTFYLFDTFSGLAKEQMQPEEVTLNLSSKDRFPEVLDLVKETFSDHEFLRIIPGAVPNTLDAFEGGPVAYLHIDMNVALPECAAFEFFWPHLVKGAPVVFDDYGFPFHRKQKEALDQILLRPVERAAHHLRAGLATSCLGPLYK